MSQNLSQGFCKVRDSVRETIWNYLDKMEYVSVSE